MIEDLKAAVQKAAHPGHRIRMLMHPDDVWILDHLLAHATRHSDNVEAVTDEKRLDALRVLHINEAQIIDHDFKIIEAALKQPDNTVEVLKRVRGSLDKGLLTNCFITARNEMWAAKHTLNILIGDK